MKPIENTSEAMKSRTLSGLANLQDEAVDRQFSMSLARGFEILRAFTATEPLLGNREIHDRTGLAKSTISRLTYTLTRLGYLNYDKKRQKYSLGSGVLSLGYPLFVNMRTRQLSRVFVEKLARDTGWTVNLGMRDRTQVVYIDTCRVAQGNVYRPDIGATRPLLSTAIGRALIMGSSPEERTIILNYLKVEDPQRYELDIPMWERDYALFKGRQFCYSIGEWRPDLLAIAVPITLLEHDEGLALNCTIPVDQIDEETIFKKIAPRLLEAAKEIEKVCRNN